MTAAIQTHLQSLPLDTLKDERLLTTYVEAWEYVCEENAAHLQYVTEKQASMWARYRDENTEKLRKLVVDYYLTHALTPEQRAWLCTEADRIVRAERRDHDTLAQEKAERDAESAPSPMVRQAPPTDPYERQQHLEQAETKHGWLGRLRGAMFGKG